MVDELAGRVVRKAQEITAHPMNRNEDTDTRGARMQLGMVGLGRMGANLTRRLMRAGHEVVVFDVNEDPIRLLEG